MSHDIGVPLHANLTVYLEVVWWPTRYRIDGR